MWEAHVSQRVCGACYPDGTIIVPIDVLSLYIGVGLRVLFLLRFHKALCLLQFSFSYASANFSFKGIIGDPLTTFDFAMSFCNQISFVGLICVFIVFFFCGSVC